MPVGASRIDPFAKFIGQALFSDKSQITLRFLTTREETIDREWWRGRIRRAAARRDRYRIGTNAYRMIYGEGDLLPSLIVDFYDGVLVLQTLSQGSEAIKQLLIELLAEEFQPRAIVERNDVRVRQHEGLELTNSVLFGTPPDVDENEPEARIFPLDNDAMA